MAHGGLWLLAGVILGSVTGAATATFLAPQRAGPAQGPDSNAEFAGRVAASMEQAVERAVERVRTEIASDRAEQSAAATDASRVHADPGPGAPRTSHPAPTASADDPAPPAARLVLDGSQPVAARNDTRLAQLVVRSREAMAERRRAWMFVGERAVAEALGLPDEVVPTDAGSERWRYDIAFTGRSGIEETGTLVFTFARGRVVGIQGADDLPE